MGFASPTEEARVTIVNGKIQPVEKDYAYHCRKCGEGFNSPFSLRMHNPKCKGVKNDTSGDNNAAPGRVREHVNEQ